ncbi:NUDIX hydrolase [Arthrobacter castelli]|uniref:NUDIX hydrolase n=1 Tax=Arthrobacter castelli TaxID=271431 RepID=UPI000407912F|nr:NUDIX domain-containing protein [Arthrobacter castelli]
MPTPDFVVELRQKIGNDLLWLPGAIGVVFDADGRVLLGKRSDNGKWTLISGMLEPGEQPAQGLAREVLEETGVSVEVETLIDVRADRPVEFGNGDKVQFLSLTFRCRAVGGRAQVGDDESVEVGWFWMDELPDLPPHHLDRLQIAVENESWARFR